MKKSLREKVWNKYHKRCAYCGCKLEYKDMQVDHIIPKLLFNKGPIPYDFKLNDFCNLNPACRACNFYKSTFSIEEFRNQMSTLHERIAKPFINRLGMKYAIALITPFSGKFYFEDEEQQYWDTV